MEHKCEQYSEEWTRLRLGKPTASGFHHIVTPTGVPTRGDTRNKYKYRLVAERLLGQAMDDSHESKWMRRGSELEEEALKAFVLYPKKALGLIGVEKCGFFTALSGRVGASPDGIPTGRGGRMKGHIIEIKCPAPYTQVGYLIDGLGSSYKAQVQGQLWVTGASYVHFWAWHPSMPPVYVITKRSEEYIALLSAEVATFCNELDEAEAHCRGLGSFRLAEKLRLSDEMTVGDILANLQE